ncbi:MAG: adenylate/guanylate cyclase domain-containing protein [Acidimicrobiia bacterium]
MSSIPHTTRYAEKGGVHIAYQTVGEGPDLIFSSGIFSNLDVMWEEPRFAHFLGRLAAFSRLTVFDMRGVGLSDRGAEPPIIERQRDDVGAVMDAMGVESAIVFGVARAAVMSMMFAATHPERTEALILYAPSVKRVATEEFPEALSPDLQEEFASRFVSEMGTGKNVSIQAPSLAGDERFVKWWARFERLVATPSRYRELAQILTDLDVRQVLPAIHVPTLVLQRSGDLIVPASQGRYAADHIAGARYVELPGEDHLPIAGNSDAVLDEVEEFVTGSRPAPKTNRRLTTVLFTDIVDSTVHQALVGDREWKQLVETHNQIVRRHLSRLGGSEQDTAGDGFYAVFDGPARAIECAHSVMIDLKPLGLEVRAGVHTGECEIADGKCAGLAVSIGARVMGLAGPSEILVSQTVRDLTVGGDLRLEPAGEHELKGIPDRWRLYRVVE